MQPLQVDRYGSTNHHVALQTVQNHKTCTLLTSLSATFWSPSSCCNICTVCCSPCFSTSDSFLNAQDHQGHAKAKAKKKQKKNGTVRTRASVLLPRSSQALTLLINSAAFLRHVVTMSLLDSSSRAWSHPEPKPNRVGWRVHSIKSWGTQERRYWWAWVRRTTLNTVMRTLGVRISCTITVTRQGSQPCRWVLGKGEGFHIAPRREKNKKKTVSLKRRSWLGRGAFQRMKYHTSFLLLFLYFAVTQTHETNPRQKASSLRQMSTKTYCTTV